MLGPVDGVASGVGQNAAASAVVLAASTAESAADGVLAAFVAREGVETDLDSCFRTPDLAPADVCGRSAAGGGLAPDRAADGAFNAGGASDACRAAFSPGEDVAGGTGSATCAGGFHPCGGVTWTMLSHLGHSRMAPIASALRTASRARQVVQVMKNSAFSTVPPAKEEEEYLPPLSVYLSCSARGLVRDADSLPNCKV